MPKDRDRPEVRVKPHTYQPSKAELNKLVKIEAMPDELAEAVLRLTTYPSPQLESPMFYRGWRVPCRMVD